MELSADEKRVLFDIAKQVIESVSSGEGIPGIKPPESQTLRNIAGSFVTLYKNRDLRGCIGDMSYSKELWKSVIASANSACLRDTRFPPVASNELKDIDIEVSVLTPLKQIPTYKDIELGRHGIVIEMNGHRAVFLPKVAKEYGWSHDETLTHLCQKAGLPEDAWKSEEMNFKTFEAIVFGKE